MNNAFKTGRHNLPSAIRRILFYTGHLSAKGLRAFISLTVSPAPCVLCGASSLSTSLCPACRHLLDEEASRAIAEKRRCAYCGRPLLSEHGICTTCRDKPLFEKLEGVFPLFAYILSKKKLLYSWKIARQHNLSEVFACYLASAIKERFPGAAVVPVPPRPGKLRKTGWDQIEDIAQYLEHVYGLRVLRILRRTEAVQQKKLTKEERSEHSKHAYVLDERAVRQCVKGQTVLPGHVVLLDDVITTGSTIAACAAVLKNAENFRNVGVNGEVFIEKVSAASLFIVPG